MERALAAAAGIPEPGDDYNLGDRLIEARLEHHWTIKDLSTRAKVPEKTIRRYEKESPEHPHDYIIIRLAEALEVNPVWLLLGRGDKRTTT